MLPWIRHRGPDGEGSFVDDGVALAHSRLAIRGLIQGRQPFSKAGCSLVFNGELYGAEVESSCLKEGCGDTSYLFSRLHQQGPRGPSGAVAGEPPSSRVEVGCAALGGAPSSVWGAPFKHQGPPPKTLGTLGT